MTLSFRIPMLALLFACLAITLSAGRVKVFPGHGIDITGYRTYQWLPPRVLAKTGVVEDHPGNKLLQEEVNRELTQRGLTEVAEGGELQIQAWVLTESIPQIEGVIIAAAMVAPGTYMTIGDPVTVGSYNREGTLYLNLIDPRVKKSAWFGMVTESLPRRGVLSPTDLRAKLHKAAESIFKKYPVKKK